jgi:hypothetical protein
MSRAAERDARKAELERLIELQRRDLSAETAVLSAQAARVDGWVSLARRMTPAIAVGVGIAAVVAGPARVGRWLRAAVVPALMIRQFLSGRR